VSGHGGGGGERWLVSYADFITLLMVLFVVLYSMGQTDVQRYKALAESLKRAFSGEASVVDPGISEGGAGSGSSEVSPVNLEDMPDRPSDTLDVAADLTELLTSAGIGQEISVQNNIEGLLLALSESLLFAPGSAELAPAGYPVLDQIADMLKRIDNPVRVTAYTDDTPPSDPRYLTNWELTAARSAAIVRYLVEQGINPERLSATGRAEYHPIFPNDTPEHRAYNRRAEIAVIYTIEEQNFVLGPSDLLAEVGLDAAAVATAESQP
jgi:chemotaxis protein MotB